MSEQVIIRPKYYYSYLTNSLGCLYLFHQAPWNQGRKHVKMSLETFHEVVKASPAHICKQWHQNNGNKDEKTH